MSFVAFRGVTGSRPSGWGRRQPGGTRRVSHDLGKVGVSIGHSGHFPKGCLLKLRQKITTYGYIGHLKVQIEVTTEGFSRFLSLKLI